MILDYTINRVTYHTPDDFTQVDLTLNPGKNQSERTYRFDGDVSFKDLHKTFSSLISKTFLELEKDN